MRLTPHRTGYTPATRAATPRRRDPSGGGERKVVDEAGRAERGGGEEACRPDEPAERLERLGIAQLDIVDPAEAGAQELVGGGLEDRRRVRAALQCRRGLAERAGQRAGRQ